MKGSIRRIYEKPQDSQLPQSGEERQRSGNMGPKIPFGELLKGPITAPRVGQQNDQIRNIAKVMVGDGGCHVISTTSLLLEDCDGRMYDRRRKQFSTKLKVERGHLLCSAMDLDGRHYSDAYSETGLTSRSKSLTRDVLFMKCLEFGDVYLRVPTTKVALLTDFETSLLKAVRDVELRFRFHQDFDLFTFVSQLSIGDRVVVQLKASAIGERLTLDGTFKPGWIEWIGEPILDKGILFGVRLESAVGDMDGFFNGRRLFAAPRNGAVLVSGDRLRNPRNISLLDEDPSFSVYGFPSLQDHYRDDFSPTRRRECESISIPISTPVTRNEGIIVPITRIDGGSTGSNSSSSNTALNRPIVRNVPIQIVPAISSQVQAHTHAQAQWPNFPPPTAPSTLGKFPLDATDDASSVHSDPVYHRHYHQPPQKIDVNVNITIPTKSAHDKPRSRTPFLKESSRSVSEPRPPKLPISSETVRLKTNDGGLVEGDRVVWFDALGIPRRGTARWIGYLRGHTNVYVGVDFDEAIGGGTGYYEGVELFHCAPNHAGLLPLSVCMKESDMGDEENNMPEIGDLRLDPSSSELRSSSSELPSSSPSLPPPPPPPPSFPAPPPPNHAVAPPARLSVSPTDNRENKETPQLAQFSVGSCVEVLHRNERRCGVVKWIANGDDELIQNNRLVAVEIEGDLPYEWQAVDKVQLEDVRKAGVFATASPDSIAIVPYCSLRSDDRFASPDLPKTMDNSDTKTMTSSNFGSLDSGIEVRPCLPTKNIENLIGRMKGIQGFRNSCYLDTTLYAMFAQSSAFDSILESRCATAADSIHTEVTDILKTEIVYPLRRFHFIRADHVLKLRRLLERLLPEMSGLTTGEKDPEELLNALFNTVLRVEPFLFMRNITDGKINPSFICPLITEDLWSEDQRRLISVQSLLERSLFASNIQFASEPKILILQLPRYGQQKVFDKIFPPQEVDITHLIYNGKRPCISCGKLADMMCPECFLTQEVLIGEVTYCGICYERTHSGLDHQPQQLQTTNTPLSASSSLSLSRRTQVPQKKLQLASVLCIETSHYVAFARAQCANKWVFFDSMADRVGLSDGYNVPQVKLCEKMSGWLCDAGWLKMRDCVLREGHLPSDVENDPDLMRLLSDCYICFYTDEENKSEGLSLTRFFT